MAREKEFYYLTFRDYKEFCDNLTCQGHKPPLQVNIEKERGTKFYTMNRLQLQQMNIHVIIQVKKIQEFDVIQFYLNHLQFSNVSTDTTVILKEKMLNEKST